MFAGVIDTICSALEWTSDWTMTQLLKNPKYMKKLQNKVGEIWRVKQAILEDDLKEIPYLKAVIKEIMRLHPSAPLIPRESTQNVKVMGYDIAAGTHLMFRPERFLNNFRDLKGTSFWGRKSCPGAKFTVVAVELALANLMFMFDLALPNEEKGEEQYMLGLKS